MSVCGKIHESLMPEILDTVIPLYTILLSVNLNGFSILDILQETEICSTCEFPRVVRTPSAGIIYVKNSLVTV